MQDSVFTKIVKGQIPCHKVYEDDQTLAFLSIEPVQAGHTLVVPKLQVEFLWDLPDEQYEAVLQTAKKVALRLRQVTGRPYVGARVEGVDVPHAHIHLIPFSSSKEFHRLPDKTAATDDEELRTLAKALAF